MPQGDEGGCREVLEFPLDPILVRESLKRVSDVLNSDH